MISIGDASIEYLDLTKKERALREKLVGRMHVRQDGTPRRIAYHAATDDNPAEYWYTIMPDGTRKKSHLQDAKTRLDSGFEDCEVSLDT